MESAKTFSSSVEISEYKLLRIRWLDFWGFHKYLEETGYHFNDFGFNELKLICKSPSSCNCMQWLHMYDSTVDPFAFAFGKVLYSLTPELALVDLLNKQHHHQ